jgi:hypothetical protein
MWFCTNRLSKNSVYRRPMTSRMSRNGIGTQRERGCAHVRGRQFEFVWSYGDDLSCTASSCGCGGRRSYVDVTGSWLGSCRQRIAGWGRRSKSSATRSRPLPPRLLAPLGLVIERGAMTGRWAARSQEESRCVLLSSGENAEHGDLCRDRLEVAKRRILVHRHVRPRSGRPLQVGF